MKKKSILLISCLVIAVLFSACAGTDSGDAKQIKAVFADADGTVYVFIMLLHHLSVVLLTT